VLADQRLLTALALAPVVVVVVLWLPTDYLALLLALVVLLGAVEWARLACIGAPWMQAVFLAVLALAMLLFVRFLDQPFVGRWLLSLAALWWLTVAVLLARVRPPPSRENRPRLFTAFSALPVLIPAWAAVLLLHRSAAAGPAMVLFLLVLVWVSDSAAYFVGRRWGRVKLAPHLSPGKTREGLYGALAGSLLCAAFLAWWAPLPGVGPWTAPLLCCVTTLASVVGDLYESLLKRCTGVKDSGSLLPGHGGLLDRIDSLTAAAPVFTWGWLLLLEGAR
jgi:phosphatidate cytidylyltransferase